MVVNLKQQTKRSKVHVGETCRVNFSHITEAPQVDLDLLLRPLGVGVVVNVNVCHPFQLPEELAGSLIKTLQVDVTPSRRIGL
jgi:hypothetical protein